MPKLISASPQQVLYVATWKLAHTWGCHAFVILSKCQRYFWTIQLIVCRTETRGFQGTKTNTASVRGLKLESNQQHWSFTAAPSPALPPGEKNHRSNYENVTHITQTQALCSLFDWKKWNHIVIYLNMLSWYKNSGLFVKPISVWLFKLQYYYWKTEIRLLIKMHFHLNQEVCVSLDLMT